MSDFLNEINSSNCLHILRILNFKLQTFACDHFPGRQCLFQSCCFLMAAFTQEAGNVNSRISSTSWGLISEDPDKSSKAGSLHTCFCWNCITMNWEDRLRGLKKKKGGGSLSPYRVLRFCSSCFSNLWSLWHCFRHFKGFKVLKAWYGPSVLDPKIQLFGKIQTDWTHP